MHQKISLPTPAVSASFDSHLAIFSCKHLPFQCFSVSEFMQWLRSGNEQNFFVIIHGSMTNPIYHNFLSIHPTRKNEHTFLCPDLKISCAGIRRMMHFIRKKNLPFTTNEIKVCSSSEVCAQLKSRFYEALSNELIKAVLPWQRISINFKAQLKESVGSSWLSLTNIHVFRLHFHPRIWRRTL